MRPERLAADGPTTESPFVAAIGAIKGLSMGKSRDAEPERGAEPGGARSRAGRGAGRGGGVEAGRGGGRVPRRLGLTRYLPNGPRANKRPQAERSATTTDAASPPAG